MRKVYGTCAIMAMLLLPACQDEKKDNKTSMSDSDGTSATETETVQEDWVIEMIHEGGGVLLDMALAPDGSVGLAFFDGATYEDGICDEIDVNPPTRLRQPIYFASNADGVWNVENVVDPVVIFEPTGLSLAYNSAGEPAIAYTGGDAEGQYCGGNDAVISTLTSGSWTDAVVSTMSGDSGAGGSMSDSGFVVGYWPALAYGASGTAALAHKDVHFGALQGDDRKRADAEFAINTGGGWSHEAIAFDNGAGEYNSIAFDGEGRPVVVYSNPVDATADSEFGVWAARRGTDGSWDDKVRLYDGGIYRETDVVWIPESGEIAVAFYANEDSAVRLMRLSDGARFTELEAWKTSIVGDAAYDEGQHVAMKVLPGGDLAMAYHRCKLYDADASGCNQNDEAVVLALEDEGGFRYIVIDAAMPGSCGAYTALAIDASQRLHVAYRCTVNDRDDFSFGLFVASHSLESL